MKKILAVLLLFYFAGCSQKPNVVTLKSGLQYADDTTGTGRLVKMGDLVTLQFSAWVIKDSTNLFKDWNKDSTRVSYLIGTTSLRKVPIKFLLGNDSFIKGSDEGMVGMKVGGTRTIIIPSELAYGKQGIGPIPPNSSLKVQIEMVNAKEPVNVKEWDVDSTKIKTTKDGLKYAILKEGTGANADSGNVVTVNYSAYLLNGQKFDSSVEREEPFTFRLGMHSVIEGWEEGLKFLNKGAKARLIIPPSLGYGERAVGKIPPNSTLIFDVEMVDIK